MRQGAWSGGRSARICVGSEGFDVRALARSRLMPLLPQSYEPRLVIAMADLTRPTQRLLRQSAASGSRGVTQPAAMMPSSYSTHIGIASISCETTSGGVITAAMMKMPTTA